MGIITVDNIRLYAYHGCLPEEGVKGGDYIVDVTIDTDLTKPAQTDELADTVDYCVVFDVVKREMGIRSKLIEQVAQRIVDGLRKEYPAVKKFSVKVTKLKPPINGPVDSVAVILEG